MYDAGDVYEDVYAGLYCVGCEAFKTEAELVDGKCPEHDVAPEWIEEKNWFFRLSAYQERLLELYDARRDFVLPAFRYNEARSFIAGGLQDFSISRAGQPWGVSIPWDPDQVAYVWADALVNYLSALTYARPGEDLRERFWPSARHLIGKDIIRFHCVFWPAMLLSAGYEVPHQLFVHGFLLLDDRKISKSLGNVVDPLDLIDVYGPDAVRFWSVRAVSFGQDGSVSIESLHERYERELGNDLGNLVSRTTAMIARFLDGDVPPRASDESPIRALLEGLGDDVAGRLDIYDLTGGIDRIWEVVRGLNRHVEAQSPWKLAEDESRRGDLEQTLYDLADGLRVIAVALASYLPETSARILEALRADPTKNGWGEVEYGRTPALRAIVAAPPLFPRIDTPAPEA
jgi:methionyl-tRNA synthetase